MDPVPLRTAVRCNNLFSEDRSAKNLVTVIVSPSCKPPMTIILHSIDFSLNVLEVERQTRCLTVGATGITNF